MYDVNNRNDANDTNEYAQETTTSCFRTVATEEANKSCKATLKAFSCVPPSSTYMILSSASGAAAQLVEQFAKLLGC
ncbi:hypothetical protein TorRG33x02_155590 [Trema orientale]|uniref:Uncharacterized protein n=1 Tax=Trema orientale TaxID=63057 RepID=A0A2P5ESY8_TREOI|nr:hypothetical protein TorRG33x02_155590 [Trema orientale]